MPRDSSGNYTLPAGNPVVSGTPISSTVQNTTMQDLAAAITGSLSRTGLGGMQSPLPFVSGNVGSPGITWVGDPTSGFYLTAAGDMRLTIGGIANSRWNASGMQLWVGGVWTSVLTTAGIGPALSGYTQAAVDETITGNWTFPNLNSDSITDPTSVSMIIGGTPIGVFNSAGLGVTGTLSATGAITQAGVGVVLQTRSVAGGTSITGGGQLSADAILTLVNDVGSPGASWYYGTNASGVKGFYPLSGVVGVPEAPIDGITYGRLNASWVAVSGGGGAFLPLTGGTLTGDLLLSYAAPLLVLSNSGGIVDQKRWTFAASATQFSINSQNDAGNVSRAVLTATKSGYVVGSISYGNSSDNPSHTFYGATTHQGLMSGTSGFNLTGTLAVTGAATISTTLGVTGASTFAATTHSGIAQFSNQVQHRSGSGAFFYDNTNATNLAIAMDNTTKQMLIGTKGALWYWDSGQTLNRGGITITTIAPTGDDVAKAGNIVLVYE